MPSLVPSADAAYHYTLNLPFWFMTDQIDGQQAVSQVGAAHFYAIGKHEGALKLAGCDAPIEVSPGRFILLFATHQQLAIFNGDFKITGRKPSNCEGNAQQLGTAAGGRQALDVIGRIAVAAGLSSAVEQALDLVEAE